MNKTEARNEVLQLLITFLDGLGKMPESEQDEIFEKINKLSPDPYISDYIFYPEDGIEMTPEEIVEKAFSYQPITLPDQSRD